MLWKSSKHLNNSLRLIYKDMSNQKFPPKNILKMKSLLLVLFILVFSCGGSSDEAVPNDSDDSNPDDNVPPICGY